MIVAANDFGDVHVVVIDNHREVVSGRAICAHNNEVI